MSRDGDKIERPDEDSSSNIARLGSSFEGASGSQDSASLPTGSQTLSTSVGATGGRSDAALGQPSKIQSNNSSTVKYVLVALDYSGKLLQIEISSDWYDEECMRAIESAYWEERGGVWKKRLSMMGVWPWRVLYKIGPAEVLAC